MAFIPFNVTNDGTSHFISGPHAPFYFNHDWEYLDVYSRLHGSTFVHNHKTENEVT